MQDRKMEMTGFSESRRRISLAVCAVTVSMALPPPAIGAEVAATVDYLQGTLSARRADGSRALLAAQSAIREQDVLRTEANSYARVKFADQGEIMLHADSEAAVERYRFSEKHPETDNVLLRLLKGGLRRVTGLIGKKTPKNEVLNTPVATIGIRGTVFDVLYCRDDCAHLQTIAGNPVPNGLHIDVTEGKIAVKNPSGETVVEAGQFAFVKDSGSPPVAVPKEQGVQFTHPEAMVLNGKNSFSMETGGISDECSIQ